mgnify:FL=1
MDRFNQTKKASILGVVGNLFLLVIKGIVGFIFSSQAMVADAANSAGDIFASLMSFIGNKIASEPSDESHNFGHGKAEYVFSLFISISMLFVSAKLIYDSGISLIEQKSFTFSWFLVLVCIITIITKLYLYMYTKKIYKQYDDLLLKASMTDHRNDCILTSCTLISIIFSSFGIFWVDGIVGMAISAWIFYTGIKIFIESYNVLMDKSLDSYSKDIILDLINNYKEIKNVDEISSTPVGYQYIVTITIDVDGNMSTFDSHHIADDLEKNIEAMENIARAIIHVNPI